MKVALFLVLLAAISLASAGISINCAAPRLLDVYSGVNQTFTATITSTLSYKNVTVSFEVYNSHNVKVFADLHRSVSLAAAAPKTLKGSWVVPVGQAGGQYSSKIIVASPTWTTVYGSKAGCASFWVNNPSHQPMPVGDLPGWTQIFKDDFTTPAAVGQFLTKYATWGAYKEGWSDSSGNGRYSPNRTLSTVRGLLNLFVHTDPKDGKHLSSAPYPILPREYATSHNGMLYGKYVARFRADPVPGYKTAWLLWPDSERWPEDGEVDFPEGNLNSTMFAALHRMNGVNGGDQNIWRTNRTYTTWRTATIEWLPNKITFTLDELSKTYTLRVPSTPMHWVIQTETRLNEPAPQNSWQGNVQLDWVAVYKPTAALLSQKAESSSTESSTGSSHSSTTKVTVIVAVAVVAAVALLAVIVVVVYLNYRKRQMSERKSYLLNERM